MPVESFHAESHRRAETIRLKLAFGLPAPGEELFDETTLQTTKSLAATQLFQCRIFARKQH